jgi:hypothetical protein
VFLGIIDSIASSLWTENRSMRPYRSSHHGNPNDKRKGRFMPRHKEAQYLAELLFPQICDFVKSKSGVESGRG